MESGGDLLFRAVSSQVPSALKGLTSVFGMGTGGTPSPLPPEIVTTVLSGTGCCSWVIPFELSSVTLPVSELVSRTLTTAHFGERKLTFVVFLVLQLIVSFQRLNVLQHEIKPSTD